MDSYANFLITTLDGGPYYAPWIYVIVSLDNDRGVIRVLCILYKYHE